MNKIIVTVLFLVLTSFCQALDLNKNWWYDFEGNLGEREIRLSVYILGNGEVKANYCFVNDDKKFQLAGKINGENIELNGLPVEKSHDVFKGRIYTDNLDRFKGSWLVNARSKTIFFILTLKSSCYATTFEHRYSNFFGSDDDIEDFMKHVKNSILNNDKEWIANNIRYPITTTINGEKLIKIENKSQLIDNFDNIFYQEYKENIKSFCTCNLFSNYKGIILGKGQIWIDNIPKSNENKFGFCITQINHNK